MSESLSIDDDSAAEKSVTHASERKKESKIVLKSIRRSIGSKIVIFPFISLSLSESSEENRKTSNANYDVSKLSQQGSISLRRSRGSGDVVYYLYINI